MNNPDPYESPQSPKEEPTKPAELDVSQKTVRRWYQLTVRDVLTLVGLAALVAAGVFHEWLRVTDKDFQFPSMDAGMVRFTNAWFYITVCAVWLCAWIALCYKSIRRGQISLAELLLLLLFLGLGMGSANLLGGLR